MQLKKYLLLLLVLNSCTREFTLPFDGLYIGNQDSTNVCNDNNPCTLDFITWKVNTETHEHYDSVCYNALVDSCVINRCDTLDCDDGSFCTDDWCDTTDQTCTHQFSCNDGDPCTRDECAGWYCVYHPFDCDDDNACTNDYCLNGVCQYNNFVNCDDGNPCTSDKCNRKDGYCQNVDTCEVNLCTFDTILDPAHNGNWCKVIVCEMVNGVATTRNAARDCNDGDACTNDYCLEYSHCLHPEVNCDDGSDCVNQGTCRCEDGYCIYGVNKIAVEDVKKVQSEQGVVTEVFLYSIDGKLLDVILRDQVKEFAMMFAHSGYPSGMYLLKSGSRTTKLIKQ